VSDTPVIDAAIRAGCKALDIAVGIDDSCRHPACDCRNKKTIMLAALRAAVPWELPAERLEAMALGLYDAATKWSTSEAVRKRHGWEKATDLHEKYRACAVAAYRADPIMRELYPEQFR
jgi:transposase